jgi:glutamine synthetase
MSSGLNGIRNKTEPPPMFEEDVYLADDLPEVSKSLQEA